MYGRARAYARRSGVAAGVLASSGYSTSFPAVENPLSDGGIWTQGLATGLAWTNVAAGLASDGTTHVAYGTQAGHSGAPFDDSIACLSGYAANQWAQATVYNAASTTAEVELLLRVAISANSAIGIEVDILTSGWVTIVRWNGAIGNYTASANFSTNFSIADGAVWYAQITGTGTSAVITVKCNGNVVVSDTLANLGLAAVDTGNPGIGFWVGGNGDQSVQGNRKFCWKAFSCGNL